MRESRITVKTKRTWEWIIMVLIVTIPLVAVFTVILRPIEVESTQPPKATARFINVTTVSQETITSATATLTWGKPFELPYRGTEGVVNAITVAPFDVVTNGQILYEVEGVPVRAFVSETPIFGKISKQSSKEEIATLNRFINTSGYLKNAIPEKNILKWTWQTDQGIKAIAKEQRIAETPVDFDANWVQWVPSDTFQVGRINISLGSDAPAAGASIIQGQPTIQEIRIEPKDNALIAEGVTEIEGESFIIQNNQLANVADLIKLSGLLTPPEEAEENTKEIEIKSQANTGTQAVPPSSIVAGLKGETCVMAPKNEKSTEYQSYKVEVVSGNPGVTNIANLSPEVSRIVTNPIEIGVKSSQCKS